MNELLACSLGYNAAYWTFYIQGKHGSDVNRTVCALMAFMGGGEVQDDLAAITLPKNSIEEL